MSCEELKDMLELYSLGLAEEQERAEIEAHLARGCDACRNNLNEALSINALMLASVAGAKPPARLKRRVMASFGLERPGWGWLGAFAAACLAALCVWLSIQERQRTAELVQARRDLFQMTAGQERLQRALSFLHQPGTQEVNFGENQTRPPRGSVFVNPRLGVLLIAGNLPALPAGKTYEMWVIPKGAAPRPAGLFQAAADGSAVHVLSGPLDSASLGAVAVSVEPQSGSPAPTTTPIIVAMLGE
ncbi:MAG TPA: anti-sigma factor [Bryobacteraceae bacterium]|nr:anti-sigma factor [Bryobacteraceae bacterium]